jgi:hypothetical protein
VPRNPWGRILAAAMLVSMLGQSAKAVDANILYVPETAAQKSDSQSYCGYRLIPISVISTLSRTREGLAGPLANDFTSQVAFATSSRPMVSAIPPAPTRTVVQASTRSVDDVPAPIILVDFDDAPCGEDSFAVSPIFESTLFTIDGDRGGLADTYQDRGNARLKRASGEYDCEVCNPCSPWYKVFRSFCSGPTCDEGIGQERIMFAPFDIEVPLPSNYFAIRYDSADGLRTPDRAEYFWASQSGAGPKAGERNIDYQDLRFVLSAGGKRFSTITEVPLRFIDAAGNGGTGGLGNVSVATKLLMIDGQQWKITQFFKTYLNTGSVIRGTANGHVSLEPGLLAQYQWSPTRYWFGELRYWFPVGADPSHAGNVLRYSVGTSKLWYETDTFAAIRTLEFVGTSVLSGKKTLPDGVSVVDVDGEHSLAILPGLRFVLGPAGDLGLFELGLQAGIATNKKGFYSSLSRIELRFNF